MGQSNLSVIVSAKDELSGKFESMTNSIKSNATKIGAALTGVGVAGLALVQSSTKMNASLGTVGVTLGKTPGQMRELALETTNVTFPLESVIKTFDELARAGVRGDENLKKAATAFDTLGDATQSNGETMANLLIPAFKNMKVEIPTSAAELDAFTYLAKQTTVDISDFANAMNYVAREGGDLGVGLNDMVAIMAALEKKGVSGTAATMKFRTAITLAAKGEVTLTEALGLTSAEVEAQRDALEDATGMTQEYADANNQQYTLVDRLKQKWSELKLQLGSVLQPFELVLGAMSTLGPVMLFLSSSIGAGTIKWIAHTAAVVAHTTAMVAVKVATTAWTAAQWLLNAAMSANPIGALALAIGGLITLAVTITGSWGKVKDFFVALWDGIKKIFETAKDNILLILFPVPVLIMQHWGQIFGFFSDIWGKVIGIFQTAWDAISGIVTKAWDGMTAGFRAVVNGMLTYIEFWVNGFIKGVNLIISALNTIQVKIPSWVPGLGGKGFGIDLPHISEINLPRLAQGGLVTSPTIAMVGEKGPEAIIPLNQTGGVGTTIVKVYLNGDEVSDLVVERISTELKLQGAL